MYTGRVIFSQLMDVIPKYKFRKIVDRYKGDYRVKKFTCWNQLLCMCFGQLTFRDSLRDLTSTLNALGSRRYHLGIKHQVPLSTISDANATRSWQIYHDLAMVLIHTARQACSTDDDDVESTSKEIYALDSTTIDLCLSLFPWAEFREHKAAIKLHTLMDLEGSIPTFIYISDGRTHDVNVLDMLPITPGGIYIMDRAYLDFQRLFKLHQAGGRFAVRAKKNLQFYRKSSTPVDTDTGLRCDQIIRLTGPQSKKRYPEDLRRVRIIDPDNDQNIVLLTNITDCDAAQISSYYKQRWQIELFFKWIKQHLRIKAFYGQTINAVKTQIWTAICTYLIIIIVQKTNHFDVKLHTMMQILSVAILGRMTLKQLFSDESLTDYNPQSRNQLGLFDF
ncbi:MAG: IS4 family transposase [Balneolaceae bacterium]|nr:IS4 family transposase [Balneolaceae bacterium]